MRRHRRRVPFMVGFRVPTIALLVMVVACGNGVTSTSAVTDGESGTLILTSPGGSLARALNAAYLLPFEKETGIDTTLVEGGDNPLAAVEAQVAAGNVQWDIAYCLLGEVLQNPDVWEPIDRSIVAPEGVDLLFPEVISDLYVVTEITAFPLLAYSTEAFGDNPPTSWVDFFDTVGFPGPRGIFDLGLESAWRIPAIGLLADGVAQDALFPLDLDRAYEKLDQLKPDILVYWSSFSQSQDIIRSGEVVMNLMTDGRALQLVNSGQAVGVSFNQAIMGSGLNCVVKGAPNKEEAFQFLNYLLSHPEQQAVSTSLTFYGPTTRQGIEETQALGVADMASLHLDTLIRDDDPNLMSYISENSDELLSRWNTWTGS